MQSTGTDSEPTVGQLVAETSREVGTLVKSHIDLAVAELKQTAVKAGTGVGMFVGAAVTALLAIIVLSIAAGYGLVAAGLGPAIAFVIVGGFWLLVTAILALIGLASLKKAKGLQRTPPAVKQTVASLKGHQQGDDGTPAVRTPARTTAELDS